MQLHPIDQVLRSEIIPALIGGPPPSDLECKLFALPANLGGLGIEIPSKKAEKEYLASALTEQILSQDKEYSNEVLSSQLDSKAKVKKESRERSIAEADILAERLPDTLKRAVDLAK